MSAPVEASQLGGDGSAWARVGPVSNTDLVSLRLPRDEIYLDWHFQAFCKVKILLRTIIRIILSVLNNAKCLDEKNK